MSLAIHARPAIRPLQPAAAPGRKAAPAPASVAAWPALRHAPAASLDEGLARLKTVADRLLAKGDRRAVFASTYLIQIQSFAEDVRCPGSYQNPAWMEKMVLDFLQRYLDAFDAYERKDFANVPAPWKAAFDRAVKADGPVVGDLLLAMNAHINHDLPLTLAATGANPSVKADYTRFNQVLCDNIDAVQALVAEKFLKPGSLAAKGDAWVGPLDEATTGMTIKGWRAKAWKNGQAILTQGKPAYAKILDKALWKTRAIDSGISLLPKFLAKNGLL